MALRAVLTDIEGTTTDLRFVHDTLFPLSRRAMPAYIEEHFGSPEVSEARRAIAVESGEPADALSPSDVTGALLRFIDEDRKETSLKALQGKIWRSAFEGGALQSHVYPDVEPALRRFTGAGLRVYVFSSGSVEAQELLFRHSEAGDLTRYIAGYFDTKTGPKREAESYRRIAQAVGLSPEEVIFLSDVVAELDAARDAGMRAVQLLRPGVTPGPAGRHETAGTFDDIAGLPGIDAGSGAR